MSPEQRQAKFREIAVAAAAEYPDATDFTYRHENVPYTLQRLRVALQVCARHLIDHPVRTTLTTLEDMHNDAEQLRARDPREFGASIIRGQEFAKKRGLS